LPIHFIIDVAIENGQILKTRESFGNPISQGFIWPGRSGDPKRVYRQNRVLYPFVTSNEQGSNDLFKMTDLHVLSVFKMLERYAITGTLLSSIVNYKTRKVLKQMLLTKRVFIFIPLIYFYLLPNPASYAGVYTDDLTRCIIESTDSQDRLVLVKWMFAAMSKHPAVQSLSTVSENQIDEANKKLADLLTKLLTETCEEKAKKAIKYEHGMAIRTSFEKLGQVAAQDLFTDPNVANILAGFSKHLDEKKLNTLKTE